MPSGTRTSSTRTSARALSRARREDRIQGVRGGGAPDGHPGRRGICLPHCGEGRGLGQRTPGVDVLDQGDRSRPATREHQDESHYGSPLFTPEELEQIHRDVKEAKLRQPSPSPSRSTGIFSPHRPIPRASRRREGGISGRLSDGTRVRIPGAFADWPPDDNQPPWGDVTYLRMYTHPEFNYIGYNTIRMYDTRLTQPEYVNRPLWDRIVGIIPYYQEEFRIDGVMIDMGHALPMELKAEMVAEARRRTATLRSGMRISRSRRRAGKKDTTRCSVISGSDEHHLEKMREFFRTARLGGVSDPVFRDAGKPQHPAGRLTGRAASVYARWALVVNGFLPAIPFIHSGFELAERYPDQHGSRFHRRTDPAAPVGEAPPVQRIRLQLAQQRGIHRLRDERRSRTGPVITRSSWTLARDVSRAPSRTIPRSLRLRAFPCTGAREDRHRGRTRISAPAHSSGCTSATGKNTVTTFSGTGRLDVHDGVDRGFPRARANASSWNTD